MADRSWIGVDFDGTLSLYTGWLGKGVFGPPIPLMVDRVRSWLADDREVRIVTARAGDPVDCRAIEDWCLEHIGQVLPITNKKDFQMEQLWDDRAVPVEKNTGRCLLVGQTTIGD